MAMQKEEIMDLLKETITSIVPEIEAGMIAEDKSLKDLGANSVDRMEIITETMEELAITVPMVEFAKIKNIGELVEFFYTTKNK